MEAYEIHGSTLPANNKLTLSTLLMRSGIFESREEAYYYTRNNKVKIRGGDVLKNPGESIRIKHDMVIKVKDKGAFRVVVRGDNLAEKREQDKINRDIGEMQGRNSRA